MLTDADVASFRSDFPYLVNGMIYCNHAATGPLSRRVQEIMTAYLHEHSGGLLDTYQQDARLCAELRTLLANFLCASSPDRIAFVTNTSEAINIIARGLPWQEGDRVLVSAGEFPANVVPFYHLRHAGVEVDLLPAHNGAVTAEAIEAALTPQTQLVAVSAVQFLSGFRADIAAIGEVCARRDVWFLVDGIQAAGVVPFDVQKMKIDALACGGQKWLMAPQGTGFLYLSEELQNTLTPPFVGWLSVANPWHFFEYEQPLAKTARRFEVGTLNYLGLYGLKTAVESLFEVGAEAILERILFLTRILMEELSSIPALRILSPRNDNERAGIVTVEAQNGVSLQPLMQQLSEKKIVVSLRDEKLRFSPHFYNTESEIATICSLVKQSLR